MISPLPHSLALCQAVLGFDLCAASDASPAPLHDSLLAPTYLTSPSFPFSMAFLALDHLKLVLICGSVPRFYPRQSLCLSLPPPFSQADSSTPAQRLRSVPRGFPCVLTLPSVQFFIFPTLQTSPRGLGILLASFPLPFHQNSTPHHHVTSSGLFPPRCKHS